jgi:hypothetical protein
MESNRMSITVDSAVRIRILEIRKNRFLRDEVLVEMELADSGTPRQEWLRVKDMMIGSLTLHGGISLDELEREAEIHAHTG